MSIERITSFEMVEGAFSRAFAIALNFIWSLRDCSMKIRSDRVRCLWLPLIFLLMILLQSTQTGNLISLYTVQE